MFLSPGQIDRQEVASGRKLNLYVRTRDLHWVVKHTHKFPHKYMQDAKKKKPFQGTDISCISFATG